MKRRYDRVPSQEFLTLFKKGGLLAPLLQLPQVAGLALDPHFRRRDHFEVYCGQTCLLNVSIARGCVNVDADPAYKDQDPERLLYRKWKTDEQGFDTVVNNFLAKVKVRTDKIGKEGAVQTAWAASREPWTPFDREAVLEYPGGKEQQARGRSFDAVDLARREVTRCHSGERWAALVEQKKSAELDQLAVDAEGRLVLIELKDGAAKASGSVYYAPLQLLQYIHEWAASIDQVRGDLGKLIKARQEVGLSPLDVPPLRGGLRAVIGFGRELPSPKVWSRFQRVLAIANTHLPAGVDPIEVWTHDGEKLTRCL